jgi:hypothetical protein
MLALGDETRVIIVYHLTEQCKLHAVNLRPPEWNTNESGPLPSILPSAPTRLQRFVSSTRYSILYGNPPRHPDHIGSPCLPSASIAWLRTPCI